jgi:dUTP pyrophosphatase
MVLKKEELLVKRLKKEAELPMYNYSTDIGLDLTSVEDVSFLPMEQKAVKTGLVVKIPEGCVGLIRDRSGIVSKMNLHTAAGTIDPGYRGELTVILVNFSDKELMVESGMKIAQLLIIPVSKVKVKEVKTLEKTERGEKGFGSTGFIK